MESVDQVLTLISPRGASSRRGRQANIGAAIFFVILTHRERVGIGGIASNWIGLSRTRETGHWESTIQSIPLIFANYFA